MSKIKLIDVNNSILETANSLFDKILGMNTKAEEQIRSVKKIEQEVLEIERKQKEKLAQEKAAQEEALKAKAASEATAKKEEIPPQPKSQEPAEVKAEEPKPKSEAEVKAEEKPQAQAQKISEKEEIKAQPPKEDKEEIIKETQNVAENTVSDKESEQTVREFKKGETSNENKNGRYERGERSERSPRREGSFDGRDRGFANNNNRQRNDINDGDRPGFQNRNNDRRNGAQSGRPDRPQRGERGGFQNNANGGRPGRNDNRNNFGKDEDDAQPRRSQKRETPRKQVEVAGSLEKPKANYEAKKHVKKQSGEENRIKPVKRGIKERVILNDDEFPRGSRKRPNKKAQPVKTVIEPIKIEKATIVGDTVSVKTFAEKTGKPVSEILKKLLLLGMMCTINSEIDFDTASLVASEFDIELEQVKEQTAEDVLVSADDVEDAEEDMVVRPPIVTIMGHVDHGKTSLLDKIRASKITETEAGGITQHIGAYQIEVGGKPITFIDTPGHEAFTAMRARGAQVTDVAILVVAADDGVMPQTIEAINHAKAAGVPIIVAINKIDKEGANPEKIKQALTEYELIAEEWGGDTIMVPVSAHTGEGIDQLLDMIILVSEVAELKANPERMAKGTIIEAKLDKGRGPVATVLVQNGTLKISDTIVAGTAYGRVRAMLNDRGVSVKAAGPSQPVEVIGFSEVPEAGDVLYAVEQDKLSKQVVEERKNKKKAEELKNSRIKLDDLFTRMQEGQLKELNIIIKADVQGSVEAVKQSLEKLSNDEVKVKAIHCGVGAIKETDVMLAAAGKAIIIGFNVRPDNMAIAAAEKEKVDIRLYRIIYNAIEDITKAMKGMLDPEFEEIVLGHVEVRQTFKVSSVGTIAGCYVTDGKITRNSKVRLLRDNVVVHDGSISSLKRFKDDVKEVLQGYECGVTLENYNDIKEGDVIESYEMREIER